MPFAHKLVLNQWLLSLFNVKRFEDLAEHLRNEALEGLDENNIHHFHHALTAQLFNLLSRPLGFADLMERASAKRTVSAMRIMVFEIEEHVGTPLSVTIGNVGNGQPGPCSSPAALAGSMYPHGCGVCT